MITSTAFLDSLEPGKEPPRIVIISGQEEFLRSECRSALISALGAGADVIDVRWGDPEQKLEVVDIFDELRAVSLFGGARLLLIRGAGDFLTENGKSLARMVADEPLTAFLCLEDDDLVKKRGKSKELAKPAQGLADAGAIVVDCSPPSSSVYGMKAPWEHELARWIVARAAKLKKKMSLEAAHALSSAEGSSLRALAGHLERLSLEIGERREITEADVEATSGGTKESNIFEFVDAAMDGRVDSALSMCRRMFEQGVLEDGKRRLDPNGLCLRVLPHFSTRLFQLGRLRELERAGMGFDEAAVTVIGEAKRWLFPRYRKQASIRTPRALGEAVLALDRMEFEIKRGMTDPRHALETFLIKHCCAVGVGGRVARADS